MPEQFQRTLFVGGGNMASALITRGADTGAFADVGVVDPDGSTRARYETSFPSVRAGLDWLGDTGELVLAVKPQVFPEVAPEIRDALGAADILVVTILAGTRSGAIRSALGNGARVVRVMPSTPMRHGRGCCAVARGAGATERDAEVVFSVFSRLAASCVAIDEDMMDAFTGLAGSGPAYVFYLTEALARAGEAVGFDEDVAAEIARHTIIGAAGLMDADPRPPAALRAAVTSKRGTTQAGTDSLDSDGVLDAIVRAVEAARDRGIELGRDQ